MLASRIDPNAFRVFLEKNANQVTGKFASDKNLDQKMVFATLCADLLKYSEKNCPAMKLALLNRNLLKGVCIVQESEWDSEHFGLKIGKSRFLCFDCDVTIDERRDFIKEMRSKLKRSNYNLAFVRVPSEDKLTINALEKQGAIFTDVLVTFHRRLEDLVTENYELAGVKVDVGSQGDDKELAKIAENIFELDHFHNDPFLPSYKSDKLYSKWAVNCLRGLADTVLVARKDADILGFITCKICSLGTNLSYGLIDLVGVSKENRGKGVGTLLVFEALEWFSDKVSSVYVGTQVENTSAIMLYSKAGFKPVYSEVTMHLWIS